MDKIFTPSSADFISYRAQKSANYGTVVIENVTETSKPDLRHSRPPDRKVIGFEAREAALETSKKNFLQAWNDYIDYLKQETEDTQRLILSFQF